ncbi:MAG: hypothetical protein JWP26_4057, partial [Devosia sp.]|uniref:tandem-95 repeat protein n=1 Tax=Devosia sp. TaxID=1871048 RepID=UPI002614A557
TSEPTRYTIAPQSGDADTSGLLQLQLTLPAGTAATQFFSANWTCSTATLICTSVTPIPADTDSSEILVDVTMTGVTATSITPSVTLSGGGAIAPITATDPTDVVQVVMNSIPTLVVGLPARFTPLAGSGGSPPYFYAFYGLGLGYNTALGEFSGTPTQAGIFTVTGSVADRTLGSRKSSTDFLVTIINPPAITGLDIAAGRPAGGTSVVISGTDFDPVAANNTVSFGGSQATVTNASTTSLTVTTPAHAAGIVDVTVSVGPATSATSAASKFEYRDAPVLTFATPGSASVLFGGTLTNAATSTIAVPGAGAISYASSDPGVAAVDAAGAITTISAGTATITATQAAAAGINELATATYALTVTSPTLGLLSSASSGNTVGIAFSQLNSASGGQATYVYTLASGVLPPGTGIDTSTGTVAGTPTAGGPFSYSVSVTDDLGASMANAVSGTIAAAAIVFNTATLPDAHPGQAYGAISLPAPTGGTAPYSFADGGGLPAGISLSPLGVLSGTPSAAGPYSFTVSVADSSTGTGPYSAVQSFQIVVQPPAQQPPVATGDAYQINQDSVLTVAAPGLLGNDTDANGDSLTAILVTGSAGGALILNANGAFVFTPNAGFSGSTSFTYKANDGNADSNVVTVNIDVGAVAPVAGPAALTVPFGSASAQVTLTLMGPVTGVGIVTPPANGVATVNGLTISYQPDANFAGADSFTYEAVNGVLASAPATVTITVAPPASVVLPATVLPAAVAGTAYSATVDPASGGNGNFSYQVIGALPGWLSFDPALRQFNGVPPTAGAFDVVLRAVDGSTGLGPFSADQTYHLSVVGSQGSIAIAVSTDGTDGQFGFSSATLALNLVVATSGGLGQSPAVDLPAARYSIRAQDMRQAGLALTDIACTDPGVAVDVSRGQVDVDLRAGQSVLCTFQTTAAREHTTALIDDFIANRANLIMTNQPDGQRRIDRLNGVLPAGGNPVSALMGYLPGIIESQPLAAAISLAAIDQMTGNQATNPLDIWMESTFALLDRSDSAAKSALVAIGADYLANPNLLIGGFVQGDFMTQSSRVDAGWIEGKGWLAGPYVTARLSDHLYLDLLAAAGRSSNEISPYGSYTDSFGATRWLASAALQGQWDYGDFTFSPAARLSYFEETSDAYIDSLGVPIPSVTSGTGQLAIGPGISWHLQTDSQVMVDTHFKFEGILAIANSTAGLQWQDPRGRIEAGIDLRLPGAANIGLTLGYDGIGTPDSTGTNAKVQLSAPL